jgi:signal transduction histidine kinase
LIFKSLTSKVIVISIALLAFGISVFALLNLKRERGQLITSAREGSDLLLQTIERSIYNSMRIGNTEETQSTLEMVAQNQKLLAVRIFHPHGAILKSSKPSEIGQPVNKEDYQLYLNNRFEGITYADQHGEILRMIKPIYNTFQCHTCHGNKTKVIGVLNVNYSLAETRRRMVEVTKLFVVSTIATIAFLSLSIAFVMFRLVRSPLNRIMENMARVEEGDLSVRMVYKPRDEIGRLTTSFNSMIDRLEKTKMELDAYHFNQMERADRLASIGEMAAGIAHEVKNPLTGIASAITIINDDFAVSDPKKEILGEVLEQVKRLDKTVNDLLFFGKSAEPEPTCTDINTALRKTLLFASQHRGSKGGHINTALELQDDLPPVYVDPKQMQQVFLNLILNAIQAMQGGGTLTIRSCLIEEAGKKWVNVSIADTGQGIPDQILEKIFTPFFTTKAQGTGLGLAICHKLVAQQGGSISVESENGKGTVFSIELPATTKEEHSFYSDSDSDATRG